MKKTTDGFGDIIGIVFAVAMMIVFGVTTIGVTVESFNVGIKAIKSISKTVVGVFRNEEETEKEKFAKVLKDQKTAADIVCLGYDYQMQRMKRESPEQLEIFSSIRCEKIDPGHVAMNHKLNRILSVNEQKNLKIYLGKNSFDNTQDFKKICKMLSVSSKKFDLENFIIELNYYTLDDELLYSTVIDKDRCRQDQYATKQGQDLEM